jgi:serine/threonine protein kinase
MTPDLIAGRYRVERAVGRGGMGTVWLCHDEILGRQVAVKQVGHLPGGSTTDTARALREARSSAALNHKNVVSVFDVVESEEGAWLVMEYVPSRTLSEILREDGPLPPERAARIGAQVADGLAAAHALGTIHRDVKPGNILVGDDGTAKISDFGIARMAGEEQLTRTGLVTGTPSYFSPELARGEDPAAGSDVYALGATLYAAVEGAPPYPEQRNAIAMLTTIATEPPPPPSRAGVLGGPIDRMMDRDPATRWSMDDAAHALHRVAARGVVDDQTTAFAPGGPTAVGAGAGLAGAGATTGAADGADGTTARTGAPGVPQEDDTGRRSMVPWLAAAAVLALVLLGAGLMMLGGDEPETTPQAGDTTTAEPSSPTSSPPSRSRSRSPSRSPEPTATATDTPEPQPTRTEQASTPGDGDAMEDAVEEYFEAMPDDTDAGWERLAPSMQAQGRDAYESWWGQVEEVDVRDATAVDGATAVDVELVYEFTDGSATAETQRLTLERSGDRYLIADDEVLSSRTVS